MIDHCSHRTLLDYLSLGLSNREIAERFSLAEGTAKNHVTSILQELGVRDRTQAAVRARELGMTQGQSSNGARNGGFMFCCSP